jgi:hypothetical protein
MASGIQFNQFLPSLTKDDEKLNDYLTILKYITKYFNEPKYIKKGLPSEEIYSIKTIVYGGFIRDIIAGKTDINDIDLYIHKSTGGFDGFSMNEFTRLLYSLNKYLEDNLPSLDEYPFKYEIQHQQYKYIDIYNDKNFDMYGNFKIIVLKGDIKYSFDISCNINSSDIRNNNTNLFDKLCDYTVNNLMTSVFINKYNNELVFGNLDIRCNTLTGNRYKGKQYTIDDIINHIQANIAIKYDYQYIINTYCDYLESIKDKATIITIDYKEKMQKTMNNRTIKIRSYNYSII